MKTNTHTSVRRSAGATIPVPQPPASGPRPAHGGKLWPGEGFALFPRKHELASALAGVSFVLPAIASGHFPK